MGGGSLLLGIVSGLLSVIPPIGTEIFSGANDDEDAVGCDHCGGKHRPPVDHFSC